MKKLNVWNNQIESIRKVLGIPNIRNSLLTSHSENFTNRKEQNSSSEVTKNKISYHIVGNSHVTSLEHGKLNPSNIVHDKLNQLNTVHENSTVAMKVIFEEKGFNQTKIINNSVGNNHVTSLEDDNLNFLKLINDRSPDAINVTFEEKGVNLTKITNN